MYKLCRALWVVAVLELGYALAVAMVAGWPWSMFAVAGVTVVRTLKRGRHFWAHGMSRWATEADLRGMIDADRGLMVGRLCHHHSMTLRERLTPLFDPKVSSKEACQAAARLWSSRKKSRLVRLSRAVHVAICAPTSAGKGAGIIVPDLREDAGSKVVLDFKGELAKLTAKYRQKKFGHRIELLDPWHAVTKNPATLNPLDFIEATSSELIDACRDLAEQLVVKNPDAKDSLHWDESAEMWIAGATAAVVRYAKETRSLQSVCDVLSNSDKVKQLVELLCNSDGMLPRLGGQLGHFQDKELASTLTSANRHLRFLSTPAVAQSTASSSFNPSDLRKGKMTVYLVLPPEHMRAQMGLLRMWVGTLMRAVVRGGLQHG
jgi:type IV secretion system protein VirD4